MKRLILMRHASAQPLQQRQHDKDRPLSLAGWQELEVLRVKLQGHFDEINLILCSNAKRTRQTLEGIKTLLPPTIETAYDDALYHASVSVILGRIRHLNKRYEGVMIVGHNPGMVDLLGKIVGASSSMGKAVFPPAATAFFCGDFSDWSHTSFTNLSLKTLITAEEIA